MAFLFNTATLVGIDGDFYENTFNDESIQAVYNSLPVPGEIDQFTFVGFRSPQSTFNVIFSGSDTVEKVERLKSCISFINKKPGLDGALTTTFKNTQICNLKMLNIPMKTIIITQVTTRYNLENVENKRITRAIATASYIELKEERKWWQSLLGLTGEVNISSLPPDIDKIKSDLSASQQKVVELTKQISDMKVIDLTQQVNDLRNRQQP
jgi:hypothetical protein